MSIAPSTPERGLVYNRASSDPTGREVSVSSQDTENRAFCDRQGWVIVGTVTDNDRSASRHAGREREGYARVREALSGTTTLGRVDVLVCWEASRANRDIADYAALRDLCATHGVLLAYKGRVYDMDSGDDRFATGIDVLVAEREAEIIRDRVMRGQRTAAANGRPHGTTPFGFHRERDPDTGKMTGQVPDPATAPVVVEIVDRVVDGHTLYSIAADLNRRAIPTPQAHKDRQDHCERRWTSATIRALLRSRSMTGVRTHNGHAHADATWQPIVSAARWAQAQQVLAAPHRARHHRGVAVKYLLSGLAVCGPCGALLRPANNRGRAVYQCTGHGVGHPAGKGHVSRPREPMDAWVTVHVVARLLDPELLRTAAQAGADADTAARDAAQAVDDLRARLDEFEASATAGGISAAAFGRIEARLSEQIETAERAARRDSGLPAVVVAMAGPDAVRHWDAAGIPARRAAVRALVRVQVNRATAPRGRRGFDASTVIVTPRGV